MVPETRLHPVVGLPADVGRGKPGAKHSAAEISEVSKHPEARYKESAPANKHEQQEAGQLAASSTTIPTDNRTSAR